MVDIVPVVMSGGSGTRLWPLSREGYPKQFLPLVDSNTMFQSALNRLQGCKTLPPVIICNHSHRFLVAEQLQQIGIQPGSIILEPFGRNTAPAIAVAALSQENPEAVLLVLAADHVILDVDRFQQHLADGAKLARAGRMVTFGIVPDAPNTGYGYIRAGKSLSAMMPQGTGLLSAVDSAFEVDKFVEKPSLEIAQSYLAEGSYFWNSGMFMFTAGQYLAELAEFSPEILSQCRLALSGAEIDLDFIRLDPVAFEKCPVDSIDYAVMEKTLQATVIPVDIGWSDVGSWASLWELSKKDPDGNRFKGDVVSTDSRNNYVHGSERLISLVGVDDFIIIDTADALLVANKSDVQEVKAVVAELKESERREIENHRKVSRPWGSYDAIDVDEGFQVKRITVNPGARLSLQLHHHRAEHWIVVEGTAEVTCGDKVFLVEKNQSTFIPTGEKHRLRNPGDTPLKIIEVQSGDYLGEDDIVRLEDDYGRSS